MTTKTQDIFSKFTNLYSLSKTLRFELKPVPRTRQLLNLDNPNKREILKGDKERAENYAIIKTYIDKLHRKFIDNALANRSIDVSGFLVEQKNEVLNSEEEDVENQDEESGDKKKTKESKYRETVVQFFNDLSETEGRFNGWVEIKKDVGGDLFNKELLDILKREYKEELDQFIEVSVLFFNKEEKGRKKKLREVFNSFKKEKGEDGEKTGQDFTTYFTDSFHNNRKNYYKADGKAGRVATRIVDENLKRYCNNIQKFKDIKKWAEGKKSNILEIFNQGWEEYIKEKNLENRDWIKVFSTTDWQDVFSVKYEYFLQNDINLYNFIIRKLNKDINESAYRDGGFLKLLKQIHGESDENEDELIVNKENVISFVKEFIHHNKDKLVFSKELFEKFAKGDFSEKDKKSELKNIYLSRRAVETISSKHFISWHIFGNEVLEFLNKRDKKDKVKLPLFIDLETIKTVLENANNIPFKELFKDKDLTISVNGNHWESFRKIVKSEFYGLVKIHDEIAQELEKLTEYKKEDENQIELLYKFSESANAIFRMTNYFALRKKGVSVEIKNSDEIHQRVDEYLDGDNESGEKPNLINKYFDALRNFVSKKPWITEKIVLSFDNSQFLGGWAKSQEKVKGGVILRKKASNDSTSDQYYLAIVTSKDKTFFEQKGLYEQTDNSTWQKMTYTQLQNPSGMLPKIFITPFLVKDKNKDEWVGIDQEQKGAKEKIEIGIIPSDEILNGYMKKKHTKDNLDLEFLQKYLNYLKDSIKKYYKNDSINFPDTRNYSDTSLFYAWVEENIYNIEFEDIDEKSIYDLILNSDSKTTRDIYIFQIYNKDFELNQEIGKQKYGDLFKSKIEKLAEKNTEKGSDNLETSYFKLLFDSKNLKNKDGVIYKLSGGAKVFYRPATENLQEKGKFRYKEDKYFLHVPIVCNFVNKGGDFRLNEDINKLIGETPLGEDKLRIISLDRGEKHLAYYSVLDENGKILEIESLNYIKRYDKNGSIIIEKNEYFDREGNFVEEKQEDFKDYLALLDKREIERMKSRKSWKRIENIKDIKDGYLSMLVDKIAKLVIRTIKEERVSIVVLENLKLGMMHSRSHIEKQIYQRLETVLAKKFNFLVDKKTANFLNAWQLTPEIKTFANIDNKSQVGIMFFVNPSFTSATCPQCGFRKRIKKIKIEEAKAKFKENIEISFKDAKYSFKYGTDEVFSDVRRISWDNHANNGRGGPKEVDNVTDQISKLFKEFQIMNENIDRKIQELVFPSKEKEYEFWVNLLRCFESILNLRNCINRKGIFNEETGKIEGKESKDFIHCPHCYFDSEDSKKWGELKDKIYIGSDQNVKYNGDANGAYNIGRKGIISIKKIKKHQEKFTKFKGQWNIEQFPKEDGEIIFMKDGIKHILKILKDEKNQLCYCILLDRKEEFNAVADERKIRKYPDLFISDQDWDEAVTNWDKYVSESLSV